jgi:hypothetical protein
MVNKKSSLKFVISSFFSLNILDLLSAYMLINNYFDKVLEAIEFLMALGSLLGIMGLLYAAACWTMSSGRQDNHLKLLVFSLGLIVLCGLYTGITYFHI